MNTKKINSLIKKETKELSRMKSKKLASEVIAAQEKVLHELMVQKEQFEKVELSKVDGSRRDLQLAFAVVNENTQEVVEQSFKVAFVKNNRPIDAKKVDGFITIIGQGKYEKAYPVLATPTMELIMNGYQVVDIDGNLVTKECADKYIVILDGQHRVLAFLDCNINAPVVVPNTHIREIKNVGEYLVDINDVGTSWNSRDRFAVAALISNNELVCAISDRIREGFNPTTASIIYSGKRISNTKMKKMLRGEELTLPEGASINIKRGDKFIQLCKEARIDIKFITKRYFINAFNSYALSVGEDNAFVNLSRLKETNIKENDLKSIKDDQAFIKMLAAVE